MDSLTLRFDGEEKDGAALHELRAAHVAEVLQGLVGLSSDFDKAGAFGDGPAGSEVLVRPAQEGSFLLEVVRVVVEHGNEIKEVAAATGVPTLGAIIWWATRSARADVKDFDYLENGNVKITWQDDTSEEVPAPVWRELQVRNRRRKKHLRQIMAPLSDPRVSAVEVQSQPTPELEAGQQAPEPYTLTRPDYDAIQPDDDVEETQDVFETEAQMSAIDFDNRTRWRVKSKEGTRSATVEDKDFLGEVAGGLAIRSSDIFRLRVREDAVQKNGKTRRKWTVLKVISHRRAANDDGA